MDGTKRSNIQLGARRKAFHESGHLLCDVVERITNGIDETIRIALRKTLLNYQLHTDKKLFEKAYGYVRKYY